MKNPSPTITCLKKIRASTANRTIDSMPLHRIWLSSITGFACILFFISGCASPYAHLRTGPGTDYFRPEFECRRDVIDAERDVVHMVAREAYRQAFPHPLEPPFLVIAGESTMALFPEEAIRAELGNVRVANRAIGGETTVMLLAAMDQDIVSLKPAAILLSIGGNDILGGRCLGQIRENLKLFLFRLHARSPRTHVILASVPPVLSWKVNSVAPYFNGMLNELATDNSSFVEYMDLWDILADPDVPVLQKRFLRPIPPSMRPLLQRSEINSYDALHFNEAGYRELARRLKPRIERLSREK